MNRPNVDFWASKKVLLTGHTGFKGSWFVKILHGLGCEVLGCGLAPETSPALYQQVETFALLENQKYSLPEFIDINNANFLKEVFDLFKPDIVFHLAAQPLVLEGYKNPVGTFQTNVMGTVNLLNAAEESQSVDAIVVITTDKVYHNVEQIWPYRENDKLGGKDPYSASKACTEIVAAAYRDSFFSKRNIGLATARAGNVIGGGDWSSNRLIPDIIKAAFSEEPISLRYPHATRPWQHVLEPLWGYLRLAECLYQNKFEYSRAYNFGPEMNDNLSVIEVTKLVASQLMIDMSIITDVDTEFAESQFLNLDSTQSKQDLGWYPKMSATDAIALTCDWYQKVSVGEDPADIIEEQVKQFFLGMEKDNEYA